MGGSWGSRPPTPGSVPGSRRGIWPGCRAPHGPVLARVSATCSGPVTLMIWPSTLRTARGSREISRKTGLFCGATLRGTHRPDVGGGTTTVTFIQPGYHRRRHHHLHRRRPRTRPSARVPASSGDAPARASATRSGLPEVGGRGHRASSIRGVASTNAAIEPLCGRRIGRNPPPARFVPWRRILQRHTART